MTAPRRSLSAKERLRLFALHKGRCHFCDGRIDATREAWEVSHEIPLAIGGADDDTNRKPAHKRCHRDHTAKVDAPRIAKTRRQSQKHMGARSPKHPSRWPPKGSRPIQWWKRDGTQEKRT